jgi:outer membrane protein
MIDIMRRSVLPLLFKRSFKRSTPLFLTIGLIGSPFTSVFAAAGLLDLYALALSKDAQLQQAQAQYLADQEMVNQANSLLLPNVSAQASYQYNDYSTKSVPFGMQSVNQQKVVVSQPLYDAGISLRYDQAKQQIMLSELSLKQEEQSLILRLAQAYFDVLRAEQLLILTEVQASAIALQRNKIAEGVKVGLTNPVDQLEVQARYDLSEADRINAETQVINTREALERLIGQQASTLKRLPLTTKLTNNPQSAQIIADTYEQNNLSVQMGKIRLELADKDIAVQKSAHYPSLSAQATLMNTDNQYLSQSHYPGQYQTNSLAVQLSVPIYTGGLVDSRTQQAEHLRSVQRAGLQQTQEQTRLNLLSLSKTLQTNQARLQALRQAVKSGEAFLVAAEEGHRVGMRELVDVLNARTNLSKAQQDLANALYDDVLNRFRLYSAQGNLSLESLRQIEVYLVDPA